MTMSDSMSWWIPLGETREVKFSGHSQPKASTNDDNISQCSFKKLPHTMAATSSMPRMTRQTLASNKYQQIYVSDNYQQTPVSITYQQTPVSTTYQSTPITHTYEQSSDAHINMMHNNTNNPQISTHMHPMSHTQRSRQSHAMYTNTYSPHAETQLLPMYHTHKSGQTTLMQSNTVPNNMTFETLQPRNAHSLRMDTAIDHRPQTQYSIINPTMSDCGPTYTARLNNHAYESTPIAHPQNMSLRQNHSTQDQDRMSKQTPHSMRKAKEPEKFDGQSTDWQDYFVQFENVARWNNWSNIEKAQQLVMSLKGNAQRLLSELNPIYLDNYDYIVQVLNRRFNPVERETAFRCEFRNRRQNRSESAAEFGYALQKLSTKAYPNVQSNAREMYVIDQFVHGLTRPELRSHVQYRHPSTIDAAIALATEFEAFEGSQGIMRKPRFDYENETCNQIKQNQQEVTLNDIADLLKNLTHTLKVRSRSNSRERTNMSDRECFKCHEKGHIAPNCPNRDKEN